MPLHALLVTAGLAGITEFSRMMQPQHSWKVRQLTTMMC